MSVTVPPASAATCGAEYESKLFDGEIRCAAPQPDPGAYCAAYTAKLRVEASHAAVTRPCGSTAATAWPALPSSCGEGEICWGACGAPSCGQRTAKVAGNSPAPTLGSVPCGNTAVALPAPSITSAVWSAVTLSVRLLGPEIKCSVPKLASPASSRFA